MFSRSFVNDHNPEIQGKKATCWAIPINQSKRASGTPQLPSIWLSPQPVIKELGWFSNVLDTAKTVVSKDGLLPMENSIICANLLSENITALLLSIDLKGKM